MRPSDKGFIFNSGKEVYANCSILSVDFSEDGTPMVTYGYDGHLDEFESLTKKEINEMCSYNIKKMETTKKIC